MIVIGRTGAANVESLGIEHTVCTLFVTQRQVNCLPKNPVPDVSLTD
jgi:hypothetical protein